VPFQSMSSIQPSMLKTQGSSAIEGSLRAANNNISAFDIADKLPNITFPMADILCESQSFAPSYDPLLDLFMGAATCGASAARNAFDAEIASFGF
jgi:hypothetical protein